MFDDMEAVELEHDGTRLRGYAAVPDGDGPFPAVLVMHSALGIAHAVNEPAARKLCDLGYLAVCTDMYGAHLEGAGMEAAGQAMHEMNTVNPERQRARTVTWFEHLAARPDVDPRRIAAIGFCYGGMTSLELARSGVDLRAAVSYHGLLTTHARAEPGAIKGHVVAFCGDGDPYAPHEDVEALRQEMLDAGTRQFQVTIFGAADHGFTDPDAAVLNLEGVRYDELSSSLSWASTLALLAHVLGPVGP
jgi:dienelactone hydrolase